MSETTPPVGYARLEDTDLGQNLKAAADATEQSRQDVAAKQAQVALDAATAEAQRILAQLATALAQAAAASAETSANGVAADPAGYFSHEFFDDFGASIGGIRADGTGVEFAGFTSATLPDGTVRLTRTDGSGSFVDLPAAGGVSVGGLTLSTDSATDYDLGIEDAFGNVRVISPAADSAGGGGSGTGYFTTDRIRETDARALGRSAVVARQVHTTTQRPTADYNHGLCYGQSLARGGAADYILGTTPLYGCLMIGESVRSPGGTAPWTPGGTAQLQPMVATARIGQAPILTEAQVNALPADTGVDGDIPVEAMWRQFRAMQLAHFGQPDSWRRPIASSCGVSSKSIEDLSYGASTGFFNRLTTCATLGKSLANAGSNGYAAGTYCVSVVPWIQGEANYSGGTADSGVPIATTSAGYKGREFQLSDDIATYVAGPGPQAAISQPLPPLILTYQTGGDFVNDLSDPVGIGQAQLAAALERPDRIMMAAPDYPMTDLYGGHLDANGYRWLGCHMGKALFHAHVLGRPWLPLHPTSIEVSGDEVLIGFHVPAPPLVFDLPYVVNTATDYANKGFGVRDDGGWAGLLGVDIVGDATVRLKASRLLAGSVSVSYGRRVDCGGNGCLRDSDPTVAADSYVFKPGTHMAASANIPALIGKPYPLHNWCAHFFMPATRA
ncbi:hypothetical protein [Roseomonas indoligenes]|uniref:Uncharacterized protein n=1 Tax=Roseomonas indoligenes TaxID=2820811 RepID=A0A940MQE4_9PROT|nr:hypothetical protein [Pararoseomonas indoligenes]MBP0492093.1 hypothetical protein [Pararoseomonas indoligenes]